MPKDPGKAMQLYIRAAEAGDAMALKSLSSMYEREDHKNYAMAAEWSRRATALLFGRRGAPSEPRKEFHVASLHQLRSELNSAGLDMLSPGQLEWLEVGPTTVEQDMQLAVQSYRQMASGGKHQCR